MQPQSYRANADGTELPDENWGDPSRAQRQCHKRLLLWDATTLLAVIVTALLGVHRQSVALAEEPEPIAEPIKPISVSDPEPTANPTLQIGTNNLRTRGHIRDIAFSPGGDQIAAVAANAPYPIARIFDVSTGRELKRVYPPDKPSGWIACVSFSPDKTKLLWGEVTGFVALWDLVNDRLLFREKLHADRVHDVSFSASGEWMASAGSDGLVRLRRAERPKEDLHNFATGQQRPFGLNAIGVSGARCLAFTPDDTRLIAGTGATAEIFIWQISDGSLLRRIENAHGTRGKHGNPVLNCLAVTPDGRRIMSSGQSTLPIGETSLKYGSKNVTMCEVCFWDIETGEQLLNVTGDEDYGFGHAALSHDGRRVAVGDFARLRIIDAATGDPERTISLPGSWGRRPEFSPDGTLVAMPISNAIALFQVATGKRLHHDEATPIYGVLSAAWSPGGERIVTGHGDGGVRNWDAETGQLIWYRGLAPVVSRSGWHAGPNFVAFTPDGRRIIVAGRRDDPVEYQVGIVAVYDAADGRVLEETHLQRDIRHAALSSDGNLLVAASSHGSVGDTQLHGVDVGTGKILYSMPPADVGGGYWQVDAMQFRSDTLTLNVALGNGEVIQFDGRTGEEQRRFVADWRSPEQLKAGRPSRPSLWEADFSPDGRTLVSSAEQYVYVWDVETGQMRLKIRHPHDHGCRISVAPDGWTFATADIQYSGDYGRDTILVFDLKTGQPVMKAGADDNRTGVLAFSSDSKRLFGGFYRGTATVWDVER